MEGCADLDIGASAIVLPCRSIALLIAKPFDPLTLAAEVRRFLPQGGRDPLAP